MIWKMYLLSNMAISSIRVNFRGGSVLNVGKRQQIYPISTENFPRRHSEIPMALKKSFLGPRIVLGASSFRVWGCNTLG